jgi:hypothetical protein
MKLLTVGNAGTFHLCVIIEVDSCGKYCVRVPAIGTAKFWQEGDVWNFRCEVGTIQYISERCNLTLVPEVWGWNENLDNILGAPYIIMDAMPGKPAHELWFDRDLMERDKESLDKKREDFLDSLVSVVYNLTRLPFDKIGALDCSDGTCNPPVAHYNDEFSDGVMKRVPAVNSNREYWADLLRNFTYSETKRARSYEDENWVRGSEKFYSIILSSPPFTSSAECGDEEESFVLTHNDLALQNILVNEDGRVTGVIDWDGCRTKPRCLGPASVPIWLQEDWDFNTEYGLETAQLTPWELKYWREVWAKRMLEANWWEPNAQKAKGDGVYSDKSAMYHALHETLEYGGPLHAKFVERVFKDVPLLRPFNPRRFLEHLGKQCEDDKGSQLNGLTILKCGLPGLFAPSD